jgi:hypothetical protein
VLRLSKEPTLVSDHQAPRIPCVVCGQGLHLWDVVNVTLGAFSGSLAGGMANVVLPSPGTVVAEQ